MSFLGVVIISMVFAIYLFVFEKSPVTYLNIPFPVSEDRDYKTGDSIQFLVERCVSYPVKYTVTRVLVNDDLNAEVSVSYLPSTDVNAGEAGCISALGIPIIVEETLPRGSWHVDHVIFVSGKFREHRLEADSTSFNII